MWDNRRSYGGRIINTTLCSRMGVASNLHQLTKTMKYSWKCWKIASKWSWGPDYFFKVKSLQAQINLILCRYSVYIIFYAKDFLSIVFSPKCYILKDKGKTFKRHLDHHRTLQFSFWKPRVMKLAPQVGLSSPSAWLMFYQKPTIPIIIAIIILLFLICDNVYINVKLLALLAVHGNRFHYTF